MDNQKTVSDKAAEEVQEGVQPNTKPQESSFENSFESLSAKKTEVEALAQRVEKIQNGNREDLELKEKKPHVELREHTKSMLSLDVRKKDILKQLKERRWFSKGLWDFSKERIAKWAICESHTGKER